MVFISCLPLDLKAEVLTTLLEVSEDGLATGAGPVLGVMYDGTSMNVRSRSHSPTHEAESTPWYDNNSSSNVRGVSHPVRQVRPWSNHSSLRVVDPIPPNSDNSPRAQQGSFWFVLHPLTIQCFWILWGIGVWENLFLGSCQAV